MELITRLLAALPGVSLSGRGATSNARMACEEREMALRLIDARLNQLHPVGRLAPPARQAA